MKKLKNFIDRNREAFDDIDLPAGHEQRFLKKLEKKKSSIGLKIWYGIAASFIFLAMLSFFAKDFVFQNRFLKENSQVVGLSDISPKYQEVEAFYQASVDEKINEFETLNCRIDEEQLNMINSELEQLNGSYQNLQAELKINRNDERIINAMIDNYQNRIRFLDLVISQIKQNC